MTSGVLATRSAAKSGGYNSAASAVDYLLREKDASGKKRDPGPVVLEGNAKLFAASAQLCKSGPSYLSLYFSDRSAPQNYPLRPVLRYLLDIQKTHLRAGLAPERFALFGVLHGKKNGAWDAHLLASLSDTFSGKKLRLLRPRADFERFAKVRALFNRAFGLPEPCLPENLQPLRLGRACCQRQPPVALESFLEVLNADLKAGLLPKRDALVGVLEGLGKVECRRNSLLLEGSAGTWTLRGYPASVAFDAPEKLRSFLDKASRFSRQVREDPQRARDRVMDLYRRAVRENKERFAGPDQEGIEDGLIIPDAEFFESRYLPRGPKFYEKTNQRPQNGRDQPGETAIHPRAGDGGIARDPRPPDPIDRWSGASDRPAAVGPAAGAAVGARSARPQSGRNRQQAGRAPAQDAGVPEAASGSRGRETAEPPAGDPRAHRDFGQKFERWLRLIFLHALGLRKGNAAPASPRSRAAAKIPQENPKKNLAARGEGGEDIV